MNRVAVAVGLLCLGIGGAAGWQLKTLLAPPAPLRTIEVRVEGGRREAFVWGDWRPVVSTTRAGLEGFDPPELSRGEIAHLNTDGTVIITSHSEASKRSLYAANGGTGWPPTPD